MSVAALTLYDQGRCAALLLLSLLLFQRLHWQ
jgi:hypothetical protein